MTNKPDWRASMIPPSVDAVMELHVTIGKPVEIGKSDFGVRRFIPITGGSFTAQPIDGAAFSGQVLSGGADWQLTRPDGITEIKAIYAIRTHDKQVIAVDNRGLLDTAASSDTRSYAMTAPRFNAPAGEYDWLNRCLFTATLTPSANFDKVIVRVFQLNPQ